MKIQEITPLYLRVQCTQFHDKLLRLGSKSQALQNLSDQSVDRNMDGPTHQLTDEQIWLLRCPYFGPLRFIENQWKSSFSVVHPSLGPWVRGLVRYVFAFWPARSILCRARKSNRAMSWSGDVQDEKEMWKETGREMKEVIPFIPALLIIPYQFKAILLLLLLLLFVSCCCWPSLIGIDFEGEWKE